MELCVAEGINMQGGRSLSLISLGFIVFILGDGSVGQNITFALIGLTLGKPEVLYWLAWITLLWSAWCFKIKNPNSFRYLINDVCIRINADISSMPLLAERVERHVKVEKTQELVSKVVQPDGLLLKIHVDLRDNKRNRLETPIILIYPFEAILWKAKHTIHAALNSDGFAEACVPRILFTTALLLAAFKFLSG